MLASSHPLLLAAFDSHESYISWPWACRIQRNDYSTRFQACEQETWDMLTTIHPEDVINAKNGGKKLGIGSIIVTDPHLHGQPVQMWKRTVAPHAAGGDATPIF